MRERASERRRSTGADPGRESRIFPGHGAYRCRTGAISLMQITQTRRPLRLWTRPSYGSTGPVTGRRSVNVLELFRLRGTQSSA
jgi:hypothetical protein